MYWLTLPGSRTLCWFREPLELYDLSDDMLPTSLSLSSSEHWEFVEPNEYFLRAGLLCWNNERKSKLIPLYWVRENSQEAFRITCDQPIIIIIFFSYYYFFQKRGTVFVTNWTQASPVLRISRVRIRRSPYYWRTTFSIIFTIDIVNVLRRLRCVLRTAVRPVFNWVPLNQNQRYFSCSDQSQHK